MGNNFPKISIITPNYNGAQFLEQTIQSVLIQQYPNLEYIIIDGGSTDASLTIIKKYASQIHYWVSEPDSGQTEAINKGIEGATGAIVNWLNADDYLLPGALHAVAQAFMQKKCNVVSGVGTIVTADGNLIRKTNGLVMYKKWAKTVGWLAINQPEVYWSRTCLETIGPLHPKLHYNMDKELWLKYLLAFGQEGIAQIQHPLTAYRIHSNSKTSQFADAFTLERDVLMRAFFRGFNINVKTAQDELLLEPNLIINNVKGGLQKQISDAWNYYQLLKADECYVAGNWQQSWSYLSKISLILVFNEPRILISLWVKHLLHFFKKSK